MTLHKSTSDQPSARKHNRGLRLTTAAAGWSVGAWVLLGGMPIALAQSIAPAPDGTGTRITVDGNRIDIGGGSRSGDGANLFHSFQQFNLNSNEIANFLATPDLRNILGRVVGGDPSRIDGLIQVTGGSPNLVLINPAGLIFGPNARLDVPGSFTATSATGMGFGDRWLNGIGSNDYAALVGDPTGFAFAVAQPGAIFNAGNLSVPFGQNLSLVGGTVLSVGNLSANGGRLTVTAVPGESFVRLTPEGSVLAIDLPTAGRSGVAPGAGTLGPIVPRSIPELLAGQPVTANGLTINPDGSVAISATSTPTQAGDISVRSAQAGTATLSASNNLFLWASQISITGDLNLLANNAIVGRDAVTLPIQISAGGQLLAWGDQQLDLFGLNHPASQLRSQGNLILSSQGRIDGNIPLSTNSQIFATKPTGESTLLNTIRQPVIIGSQSLTFANTPLRVQRLPGSLTLFRPITLTPFIPIKISPVRPIGTVNSGALATNSSSNSGGSSSSTLQSQENDDSNEDLFASLFNPNNNGQGTTASPADGGGSTGGNSANSTSPSNTQSVVGSGQGGAASGTPLSSGALSQTSTNLTGNSQSNPSGNSSNFQNSLGSFPTTPPPIEVPSSDAITINSSIDTGKLQGLGSNSLLSSAGFVEVASLPSPINIDSSSILSSANLPAPPPTLPAPEGSASSANASNPANTNNPPVPGSLNPNDLQANHEVSDHLPDDRQPRTVGILDLVAMRTEAERSLICQLDPRRPEQLTDRLDCERKILERTRRSQSYQQTQVALIRLGSAYYEAGQYPQAIKIYQESQDLAAQQSDVASQVLALRELGNIEAATGTPKQAIAYYEQALKLADRIDDARLKVAVLNSLALTLINQNDYAQGEQQQRAALALAREHRDVAGEALALTQLGLLHYQQAKYPQAIAAHQDSLTLAKQLGNPAIAMRALDNLGLAFYAQKDFANAAITHAESLKLARDLGDVHHIARALTNLGDSQWQLGQLQPAAENLEAAIQTWETVRNQLTNDAARLSIFEIQETTYSTLQSVLIADRSYERALEMDERGRTQALLKLLSKPRGQSLEQNPTETARSPRELGAQIDLQRIRQVARDQAATLITYSIERITVDRNQKREIADIAINIWVVKPSGEVHFRQVLIEPDLPLREQIPIARSFLASRLASRTSRGADPVVSSRALTPGLRQLDRYLIEPIADLLPEREGDRLIFMPHQDLFLVPFSALQNAQGRYLIERYSLAVAPSIQVLDRTHARANQLRQQGNQAGQPLIVGNPVMPLWPAHLGKKSSDRPAPLPNSESEARAVAQMLNVQPLTGANATKNAVLQRLEQASLIHLATHGILDSERGLDSAIALAPMNDGDDGWLTARELLNLDLNAQLVVLSACNTGQGALSGDGIIGLSRSLLAVGVPSAIVTQWAVPDAPTAALMTRFYEFLGQGLDKSAALRQATLATMQQYPDPIDWAAFTLIGDTH